jgi:hypothetical protein
MRLRSEDTPLQMYVSTRGIRQRKPSPQAETGGKRELHHPKFDFGAPWDCLRFPPQHYGPTGAAILRTSVRMACNMASVRPRALHAILSFRGSAASRGISSASEVRHASENSPQSSRESSSQSSTEGSAESSFKSLLQSSVESSSQSSFHRFVHRSSQSSAHRFSVMSYTSCNCELARC